ncbi:Uncharacterised protein [Mycolicibacterium phlei]|nr:hypothetical protein MPHLCCUG_01069 [Mycolicibacterium phlei]STZ16468.1 Uncharacterised protein [Mycolicibacterium phlei]VEG08024.1 Uncharacterised protein [Mycobacteroides chelonae]
MFGGLHKKHAIGHGQAEAELALRIADSLIRLMSGLAES